ncbi:hypothetical protein [Actinomadura sp. DC4]|uniref:hypothetical protein n=1 Tax=Actinomadura sp. DC4 TaxID=3055069 RepID=UPI0025AF826C|nr:hypothetical protein [Actinomadura sp. DC4]MDN3351149.1 hypothetical protein [Actinomadura sp. DC4]
MRSGITSPSAAPMYPRETETDPHAILDRLGDPRKIADEARRRFGSWMGLSALAALIVAGPVAPVTGAGHLAVRPGRRPRPLAWAGGTAVLLIIAAPTAVSLTPSHTSAFPAGHAAPRPVTSGKTTCGAFYTAKHFPGRGVIGTNVCTVRAQGHVLLVDADIAERATTAPAFDGSEEYGWVINPGGTFQTT